VSINGTGPEQLESDIERQRAELAATVSQLQAKLDVKSRAQHRAAELKDRATTATGRPRPDLTVAAVAVAVLVTGLLVRRRRH
jgi:MYXO-CTERM domain-containing protein